MMAQSTRNSRPAGHFWFMRLVHVSTIGLGLLLLSAPSKGFGQGDWDIGFTAGMANYMGDIGDGFSSRRDFVWDLQELRTRPAFGLFVRRKLDRDGLWWVRGDVMRIHIAGHDKHTDYDPGAAATCTSAITWPRPHSAWSVTSSRIRWSWRDSAGPW